MRHQVRSAEAGVEAATRDLEQGSDRSGLQIERWEVGRTIPVEILSSTLDDCETWRRCGCLEIGHELSSTISSRELSICQAACHGTRLLYNNALVQLTSIPITSDMTW